MSPTRTRLGDHISVLSGFAFDSRNFGPSGDVPIIRIRDVVRGSTVTYFSGGYDEKFIIERGDLLIGMDGDFNRALWRSDPALLNQRVCKVTANGMSLSQRYLFHILPAILQQIWHSTAFATVKHLSVKTLREVPVALPSLAEQDRIADILDKAESLRAKRREAIAHLNSLNQSIFYQMFGDVKTLLETHSSGELQEFAEQITDGEHLTPKRSPEGYPLLSARNVRSGFIAWSSTDYVPESEFQRIAKRCAPRQGDVLISCSGTIGRVAPVVEDIKFALVRSVALVRPSPHQLLQGYLVAYLQTPYMQARMRRAANASSQANLFQGPIRTLPMAVPPLRKQEEFIGQVAVVEGLKTTHRSQLAKLDNLFLSLQDCAFKGEL